MSRRKQKKKNAMNAHETHRIVILNDGETFSNAEGAVVVEYEGELPAEIQEDLDNGDPRPLRGCVEDGLIAGRVHPVVKLDPLDQEQP